MDMRSGRRISRRTVLAGGLGTAAAAAIPIQHASGLTPARKRADPAPYRVGAFYFTQWNPELNPSLITQAEATYGPPDGQAPVWWDGPRQHIAGPGPWGYGPVPEREPLIGYYDDREQEVIDQHILQAASRGIDHLAFYYYWANGGGGERPGQQALHNFTRSQYNDLLDFYLYVIADGGWPASDWTSLIVPNLVEFVSHPSYMTTDDGRPIIGFYGDFSGPLGGTEQLTAALNQLRTAVMDAGHQNPLFLVNGYRTLAPQIAVGYDGFLPLNLAGIGLDSNVPADYASSYPPAWKEFVYADYPVGSGMENYENYLFVPGGLGAFDARPWRMGYGGSASSEIYAYTDPSPATFRAQLKNVKDYLDSHPRSMNMTTFYCWNEFGEGGVLEPSTIFQFGNLNALQETFGLSNAKYKAAMTGSGLPDLDPEIRLETAPERAMIGIDESVRITTVLTNNSPSAINSVQVTFDPSGWNLLSPGQITTARIDAGASEIYQFTVTPAPGSRPWSKHPAIAHVSYTGGQSTPTSTFVVPTPSVYAVMERPAATTAGSSVDTKIRIRNHSLTARSGSFAVTPPSGWPLSGATGTFSLSAYSGGPWSNREIFQNAGFTVPASTPAGDYVFTTTWDTDGMQQESTTTVTVS